QLIDGTNERTLWAEQYDRELKDVFTVQSDIAVRIAQTLGAALSLIEQQHIQKQPTESLQAYQLFLRSQAIPRHVGKTNEEAMRLLQEAIDIDPKYGLAVAWLAYRQGLQSYIGSPQYLQKGIDNARKALAIDPNLAEGHFALASGEMLQARLASARISFMKAL